MLLAFFVSLSTRIFSILFCPFNLTIFHQKLDFLKRAKASINAAKLLQPPNRKSLTRALSTFRLPLAFQVWLRFTYLFVVLADEYLRTRIFGSCNVTNEAAGVSSSFFARVSLLQNTFIGAAALSRLQSQFNVARGCAAIRHGLSAPPKCFSTFCWPTGRRRN